MDDTPLEILETAYIDIDYNFPECSVTVTIERGGERAELITVQWQPDDPLAHILQRHDQLIRATLIWAANTQRDILLNDIANTYPDLDLSRWGWPESSKLLGASDGDGDD